MKGFLGKEIFNTSWWCTFETYSFSLQKDFEGVGMYSVMGSAKLFSDDGCASRVYSLSCSVKIENDNDSPKVHFIDVISVIQK